MSDTKSLKEKDKRIQFDVVPERIAQLDQLVLFCDLRTRKDLFDNAMTLFEWAVHEVRSGNLIASYNKEADHVDIVRLPVLDNAARKAKSQPHVQLVGTGSRPTADVPKHRRKAAIA